MAVGRVNVGSGRKYDGLSIIKTLDTLKYSGVVYDNVSGLFYAGRTGNGILAKLGPEHLNEISVSSNISTITSPSFIKVDETHIFVAGSNSKTFAKVDKDTLVKIADSPDVDSDSKTIITGLQIDEEYIYIAYAYGISGAGWSPNTVRVKKYRKSDLSLVATSPAYTLQNKLQLTKNLRMVGQHLFLVADYKVYKFNIDTLALIGTSLTLAEPISYFDMNETLIVLSFGANLKTINKDTLTIIGEYNTPIYTTKIASFLVEKDYVYIAEDKEKNFKKIDINTLSIRNVDDSLHMPGVHRILRARGYLYVWTTRTATEYWTCLVKDIIFI